MRAYTLITAPDTPACHKVRTYLRWRNIPFLEKPATELVLRSEVRPRLRRIDVPLLIAADQRAWSDSRVIVDAVDSNHAGFPMRPDDDATDIEAAAIEAWLDQLVAPAASFWLWARDGEKAGERLAMTAWPDRANPARERRARMARQQIGCRFRKMGYREEDLPAIETRLDDILGMAEAVLGDTPFLFGGNPTLADCSLHAVVLTLTGAAEGQRFIRERPALQAWLLRMAGPIDPQRGTLKGSGPIPTPLSFLLDRAVTEFVPVGVRATSVVAEWGEANPGQQVLPQSFPDPSDPAPETYNPRTLRPADAWLLQRLCSRIRQIKDARASRSREALDRLGLSELRGFKPRRTVLRRNYRFELEMVPSSERPVPDAVVQQVLAAMGKAGHEAATTSDVVNLVQP